MPNFRSIALAALTLGCISAGPALAQMRGGFDDMPTGPGKQGPTSQAFSFSGDELKPSYDRKYLGNQDPRYTGTLEQQKEEARQAESQKPGGGCLRYGAVGAAGGHLAGHSVVGALAGCAVGSYVRHREKAAIRTQQAQ